MYNLRPYQKDLIDQIFKAWGEGARRVLAQLSTGGGKTVIIAHIARAFLEEGEGVMLVAHRKELIIQGKEKLESVSGLECGIIKSGYPEQRELDVQVASIQSLARRKFRPDIGLLIFDEAHHCCSKSYTDLMEQYPNAYILGVTATPHRADGQGFKLIFDKLVTGISAKKLIQLGHLSKFKIFGARPISTKGIKTTGGDFDQDELEDRAMSLIGDIVPTWENRAREKQTIIFAVSVLHSKKIVEQFIQHGYSAEHVDGGTPDKEREEIIERFRTKETTILSNVGIFTEGFDLPNIEAVQCLRPTMSLVLWLQMVGRGLRPAPDKEHCIIIDHSDNWSTHGLPDEDRTWRLEPISLKPTRYTQECPKCHHIFTPLSHEQAKPIKKEHDEKGMVISTHLSTCPNCQHKFEWTQGEGAPESERFQKREHGEIVEIDVQTTEAGIAFLNSLIQVQESTSKKKGWIYYQVLRSEMATKLTLGDWRYLANHLGYREGWAYKALQDARAVQLTIPGVEVEF